MKRLIIALLIAASTSAIAQPYHNRGGYHHQPQQHHRHYNYAPAVIGALILGGAAMAYSRPYYGPPQHIAPMYGNQCPIVNGYQTVPILTTNQYGYQERVGCGYPQ